MTCEIQDLIDDARCFFAVSPQVLSAIQTSLWCSISESISTQGNPSLLSDDGEWYELSAVSLGGGDATLNVGNIPQSPGANEYLVLVNLNDGLKYKFGIIGTPPLVEWYIDPTPTLEPETPTTLESDGNTYELNIVFDGGLTFELNPI